MTHPLVETVALSNCTACKHACEVCRDGAERVMAAILSNGYAIVPVEPTEEMHDGARDWSAAKYGKPIGSDASQGCWSAMLSSAPKVVG